MSRRLKTKVLRFLTMCLSYNIRILSKFIFIGMLLICNCCLIQAFHEESKCYDGLGCVRLTAEWVHQTFRPINNLPSERHAINTIFVHWSLHHGILKSNIFEMNQIKMSGMTASLKIMVHDFTSNGYTGWIQHLSRGLLDNSESACMNIVSVDWAAGAEPPYEQAVANARLVALEIVQFLNNLQTQFRLKSETVHIIGHGVGSHIAGYVGKMKQLQRITALDPSGPYFKSMPPNVRLHENDAKFVDVVHTDSATYGQGNKELLGHVDYFPNGGRDQPGCLDLNIRVTSVQRGDLKLGETLSACSHKRSIKYYIEALVNPSCVFLGVACRSYRAFLKGKCSSCGENFKYCVKLHPLSTPQRVNNTGFFFVTATSSPFCGEILKVLLILKSKVSGKSEQYVKGYFNVTVPQANGSVGFLLNENHLLSSLRADDHHVFIVFRSTPPVLTLPAPAIHIMWHHGFLPCSWCTAPKITGIMIFKMTDEVNTVPQWFCPVNGSMDDPIGVGFKPCHRHKAYTTTPVATTEGAADYYENYN